MGMSFVRAGAVTAVVTMVAATALSTSQFAAAATVVTVDTGRVLATVGSTATGVNDWQADANIVAPGTARLLTAAGARIRELNAGPYDDVYRWRTNTYDGDPITDAYGAVKAVPWQSWATQARRAGDQMMVHVNYGSTATDGPGGSDIGPQEAADWVRQANIVNHDGIKYWVIGEEVWGNGFLFPATEPDHHTDKTPASYGANVVKFARAMKAVDPSIRIGVELTPFGSGGGIPDWNDPVLAAAGNSVDFVDVHWYDYFSTDDAGVLGSTAQIPKAMQNVRGQLTANLGTRGAHVPVVIGETNAAVSDPGKQSITAPSALYAADDVTSWLEQGAGEVNWFDSHHQSQGDKPTSPDDPTGSGYGTWGLLSDGPNACATNATGATVCQPRVNTPFPAYFGYGMGAHLASPGARLVRTTGASSPIVTHAALQPNGTLVVLVENEDPTSAHDVQLAYTGFQPKPVAAAVTYGTSLSVTATPARSVHLTPYSMTELVLTRS